MLCSCTHTPNPSAQPRRQQWTTTVGLDGSSNVYSKPSKAICVRINYGHQWESFPNTCSTLLFRVSSGSEGLVLHVKMSIWLGWQHKDGKLAEGGGNKRRIRKSRSNGLVFFTLLFGNDKHLHKLVISYKWKEMPTSESGQMQEMWNNNAAGEFHYKTARQARSWVRVWLIPQAQPLDEYSELLFTKLLSIHHLTGLPRRGERYLFSVFLPSGHGGWFAPSHTPSLVEASLLPPPPSQGARGSDYRLSSRQWFETWWRKRKCCLTPTTLYDREKGLHMETEREGVGSEMVANTSVWKVIQLVWWERRV